MLEKIKTLHPGDVIQVKGLLPVLTDERLDLELKDKGETPSTQMKFTFNVYYLGVFLEERTAVSTKEGRLLWSE